MAFATHILVPTDFSDAAALSVRGARLLAEELGARITLLHVHDPDALRPPATLGYAPIEQRSLEAEILRNVREGLERIVRKDLDGLQGVECVVVQDGSSARAICDYAEQHDVDLIVLATHGRTGLKHLLIGSVAEQVVRHARVPVLTLRSTADD